MHFYTLKEAAAAIADEMHPTHEEHRSEARCCYLAALDNAVGTNVITYRDPVTRLPMQRAGIAASMAAQGCVFSAADLNAWLVGLGVGIQIRERSVDASTVPEYDASGEASQSKSTSTTQDDCETLGKPRPTSADIAEKFARFLVNGEDVDWLKKMLGDVRNRPRLAKLQKLMTRGKREIATWDAGGVALYLVAEKYLTRESAIAVVRKYFPEDAYVFDGFPCDRTASWIPNGI